MALASPFPLRASHRERIGRRRGRVGLRGLAGCPDHPQRLHERRRRPERGDFAANGVLPVTRSTKPAAHRWSSAPIDGHLAWGWVGASFPGFLQRCPLGRACGDFGLGKRGGADYESERGRTLRGSFFITYQFVAASFVATSHFLAERLIARRPILSRQLIFGDIIRLRARVASLGSNVFVCSHTT
jgi:hypothetical protein